MLTNRKLDILITTKVWLQDSKQDEHGFLMQARIIIISDVYKNRGGQRGWDIALITNKNYKVSRQKDVHTYSSFKHNIWNTQLGSRVYTIIEIYYPPQGTEQQFNNSNFIDQFTDLLTEGLPKYHNPIIMWGHQYLHKQQ